MIINIAIISLYRHLVAAAQRRAGAAIWAYCNHVHFIVTSANEDGLRATFAEAHREGYRTETEPAAQN
jgi:hypothetical protein